MIFDSAAGPPHLLRMDLTVSALLPLVTLGTLGAVIPAALAPRFPDTLAGLARALLLSVVLLIGAGSLLFILLYRDQGMDLAALASDTGAALWHFSGLGLKSALVWGPVTALTALVLAQGVERRKGERMAARDPD